MVTGGKQMEGFVSLFARIVQAEGIPASAINVRNTMLPRYFRSGKDSGCRSDQLQFRLVRAKISGCALNLIPALA